MIDPAALKALVLAQPTGSAARTAYAAGNDVATAAALNALAGAPATRDATFGEFQAWAVQQGVLAGCRAALAGGSAAAPVKALAQQVLDLYGATGLTVVYHADVAATGAALVAAGIVPQAAVDALTGPLVVPQGLPQQQLGAAVTAADVYRTRSLT